MPLRKIMLLASIIESSKYEEHSSNKQYFNEQTFELLPSYFHNYTCFIFQLKIPDISAIQEGIDFNDIFSGGLKINKPWGQGT